MLRLVLLTTIAVHLAAFGLMLFGLEPVSTFYYGFAWWTYILALSSANHLRRGNSLLFGNPREFVYLFLFSTPVWLFFELYNFRLENWHYVGLPLDAWIRWPGYVVAFGTVLPGIFETEVFVENYLISSPVQARRLRISRGLLLRLVLIGAMMMALPLILPTLAFPLIWLGPLFLLDPLLYRLGGGSLLEAAEQGDYSRPVRLLAAGMLCGLLWEFWNFWASAKWVYEIPYLGFLKIFEMPLLGFLGFPPFALDCYLFYRLFLRFRASRAGQTFWAAGAAVLLAAAGSALVLRGIDRWTVQIYKVLPGFGF